MSGEGVVRFFLSGGVCLGGVLSRGEGRVVKFFFLFFCPDTFLLSYITKLSFIKTTKKVYIKLLALTSDNSVTGMIIAP